MNVLRTVQRKMTKRKNIFTKPYNIWTTNWTLWFNYISNQSNSNQIFTFFL